MITVIRATTMSGAIGMVCYGQGWLGMAWYGHVWPEMSWWALLWPAITATNIAASPTALVLLLPLLFSPLLTFVALIE